VVGDNCAVDTVYNDGLSVYPAGFTTVTWTVIDIHGNINTASQTVEVQDLVAPDPVVIPNAEGECTVTVDEPTTNDGCSGVITGTTSDPTFYDQPGTYTITWSFDDGNGNITTAEQTVIVVDTTDPDIPVLDDLADECAVYLTAPTTEDNCAGTIEGTTTDPLAYTDQGAYVVTWTFDDGNGNVVTATQNITIEDVTAPDDVVLDDIVEECEAIVPIPTTTDNCAGTVSGTTTDETTYTDEGTYTITWTFDDGNGNVTTAEQTIIIDDVTPPEDPGLTDIVDSFAVTVPIPEAYDECAGYVQGTTSDPLIYNYAGTYVITWTFDDGRGNVTTVEQNVTVLEGDPVCQWCTGSIVQSEVALGPGSSIGGDACMVPDILVDVRMDRGGDNDVVHISEIGTGAPATWSIQAAIDYINANGDPTPDDSPGEIFIGVIAADPVPIADTVESSCGRTCGRPNAVAADFGTENVLVNNQTADRLHIIGCNVTMKPDDPTLPVFTVEGSSGDVNIINLHVTEGTSGYYVKGGTEGNSGNVTIGRASATFMETGYLIDDDNVIVRNAPSITSNQTGILATGTDIQILRNRIINKNSIVGIKVTGDNNTIDFNVMGTTAGSGNGTGLWIVGSGNSVNENTTSHNLTYGCRIEGNDNIINDGVANRNNTGIWITGSGNNLDNNSTSTNQVHGYYIQGDGNVLNSEDALSNTQIGIYITGNLNSVTSSRANSNVTQGFYITGEENTFMSNTASNNGQFGMLSEGPDNSFGNNIANSNYKQGIRACTNTDLGGNTGINNGRDPQVQFICIDTSLVRFVTVDIRRDKAYHYDSTFTLVRETLLDAQNTNANDVTYLNSTSYFVIDKTKKQVYRYGPTPAVSMILKSTTGTNLSNPIGIGIYNDELWVADAGTKFIYRYSLSAAYNTLGSLNALQQIKFNGLNGNASGLLVDAGFVYVLDGTDRRFYRYPKAGGTAVGSRILKDFANVSLKTISGATWDGSRVWITDLGWDRVFCYDFNSLGFGLSTNLLPISRYQLFVSNANATGIAYRAPIYSRTESAPPSIQSLPVTIAPMPVLSDEAVSLYPNPAKDRVMVKFPAAAKGNYKISLVDANGSIVRVFSGYVSEGGITQELRISGVAQGSYFLVFEINGKRRTTQKLIVY
jgi:hypothetical protein